MNFCSVLNKINKNSNRLLYDNYRYAIAETTQDIVTEDWENVNRSKNIFLSVEYLRVLEKTNTENYKYFFVTIYEKNIPVGISFFQLIVFNAELFGNLLANQISCLKEERGSLFTNYLKNGKGATMFRLLTLGNNFVSGEHGFSFEGHISRISQFEILQRLIEMIGRKEKLRGKISAILIKDFYPETLPEKNNFLEKKYLPFAVEPNMVLQIPENIISLKDYIALFSKKYRKRTRTIFNCAKELEKKEMNLEDIQHYHDRIYELYLEVYDNAKFKLVKLGESYFYECKKAFGNKFKITGFFRDGQLIGFNTAFLQHNDEIEAHFIGFDYAINRNCELYQNILYQFIELAIVNKKTKLILGRTAAEIKSTIGAKSADMICFVKPQNPISKLILKPFISYLQPSEWIPRNPFKED